MNKIKEAYDALMEAIVEETGATPNISIDFHSHIKNNEFFQNNRFQGAVIAWKMHDALRTEIPAFDQGETAKWFQTHSGDWHTKVNVFM